MSENKKIIKKFLFTKSESEQHWFTDIKTQNNNNNINKFAKIRNDELKREEKKYI